MNFLGLEYFVEVVNEKSFRKAAKKLFISEQALSEQIKKLEEEIGTKLILRTRPQSLTPAGEICLENIKSILNKKEYMIKEIRERYVNTSSNKISIGVNIMESPYFISDLLLKFREKCPKCKAEITYFDLNDSLDKADLYLIHSSYRNDMENIILKRDEICVAVNEDLLKETYGEQWEYICYKMSEIGEIGVLRELPFIGLSQFKKRINNEFTDIYKEIDLNNTSVVSTYSKDINDLLCLNGYGALIVVANDFKRMLLDKPKKLAKKVYMFPLKNKKNDAILTISYKPDKVLRPVDKAFIDVTKKFFESMNK